jgi:hypothetical protein
MRLTLHTRIALLLIPALGFAACDSHRPSPYIIAGPTVPSLIETRQRYVWDSADELRVWIDNPVSKGDPSMRTEGDAEFIHIDLPNTGATYLRGPDLSPLFVGLRAVRLRYRWSSAQVDPTVGLLYIVADVEPPTVDPRAILRPYYWGVVSSCTPVPGPGNCIVTPHAGGEASAWHTIDLVSDNQHGYPPIVDARYIALWPARHGAVTVDIDRIELLQ